MILFKIYLDEKDEMIEEYLEHDMPGEIPVSLSQNSLNVSTEDIK